MKGKAKMEKKYLERGNIVEFKKGMRVKAKIAEKFAYANYPFSSEEAYYEIRIGDELTNSEVETKKEEIKAALRHILVSNCIGVADKEIEDFINPFLEQYHKETLDTSIFAGRYVVITTYNESGSNVICQKLKEGDLYDPNGIQVCICQDKRYSCSYGPEEIQPVGDLFKLL